jgi:hypothetical protein
VKRKCNFPCLFNCKAYNETRLWLGAKGNEEKKMKTRTTFILSLTAIVALAAGSVFGAYSGGTGDPCTPYQIADVNDLLALAADTNDYNKCFILTADINMGGQVFTTAIIGSGSPFTGTFDGNGHKITNFTINGGSNSFLGLFGIINPGGSVKNLGLENSAVSGYKYVGGLVGNNINGTIRNCYSTGQVNGYYLLIGGLVGENFGSISCCYSTGIVSGSSGTSMVGGLVGDNDSGGVISSCYSTGTVSVIANGVNVGGLAGMNYASSIINCYATGSVSGSDKVGGLVGRTYHGSSINYCFSAGQTIGSTNVGGLVGGNDSDSNTLNSFWDIQTSGQTTSAAGTGQTTAQMKTLSTFTSAGWDFTNETTNGTDDYWRMCVDGVNYPQLNWQYAQYGDFACPDGVSMEDLTYFVGRWLESDCTYANNNNCGGTDMDVSGTVDFKDFAIFAENWLSGE